MSLRFTFVGRDSSVGIATCYGLESPGIESRLGRDFGIGPDRFWGPPILLYNGYRLFPGGKGGRGLALTTHRHLALRLKKDLSYTFTTPLALHALF